MVSLLISHEVFCLRLCLTVVANQQLLLKGTLATKLLEDVDSLRSLMLLLLEVEGSLLLKLLLL